MTHHEVDRIAYHEHLARQREREELQALRDDWQAQAAEDDRYTERDEA